MDFVRLMVFVKMAIPTIKNKTKIFGGGEGGLFGGLYLFVPRSKLHIWIYDTSKVYPSIYNRES